LVFAFLGEDFWDFDVMGSRSAVGASRIRLGASIVAEAG
jgi:hypothetical protein